MAFTLRTILVAAGMFVGMLVFLEIGRWLGVRERERAADREGAEAGIGAMEGAVFALFGLLIAFTFSGAMERFDHRRELIVDEANAIGTAYLRLDLLPAEAQPALRVLFRQYLESQLSLYHEVADPQAVKGELERATALQEAIWKQALEAARATGNPQVLMLVASSLNAMIDSAATRVAAARKHTPKAIFGMLFVLAFASALLAGRSMAASQRRKWLHMLVFACAIATSVFVILNLEFPRLGLIRIEVADQALVDVLEGMK